MWADVCVFFGVGSVLVLTIYNDLRRMRIPNWLTLVLLALFPLYAMDLPNWAAVGSQIGFAAVVFGLGFAAFAARLMGGGDVKIMAGLALYAPLPTLPIVLLSFSGAIMISTVVVLGMRRGFDGTATDWTFLNSRKFPLGLPIGLAGLAVLVAG